MIVGVDDPEAKVDGGDNEKIEPKNEQIEDANTLEKLAGQCEESEDGDDAVKQLGDFIEIIIKLPKSF